MNAKYGYSMAQVIEVLRLAIDLLEGEMTRNAVPAGQLKLVRKVISLILNAGEDLMIARELIREAAGLEKETSDDLFQKLLEMDNTRLSARGN